MKTLRSLVSALTAADSRVRRPSAGRVNCPAGTRVHISASASVSGLARWEWEGRRAQNPATRWGAHLGAGFPGALEDVNVGKKTVLVSD